MEVTQEMLEKAVKKAVELGVIPKYADAESYLRHWDNIKKILEAALEVNN